MLSQVQASYRRVEQSLERLAETIAAYNPSTTAANELAAADDAVNNDLERLIVHQSNHLRIQELRQTTESLNQTLKRTIQLLADARKEIQAIPSSSVSEEPRREVEVDELLAYAKFISKTTVPPTFRKQDVLLPDIKKEGSDAQIMNGIATPPTGGQDHSDSRTARTGDGDVKDVNEDTDKSTDASRNFPFVPWPSQDVIQRGALSDIQRMLDSGQDPADILTADEQAQADKDRKAEEDREKTAQEEAEKRRMSMFDTGAMRRRETVADVFDPDNL